MIEIDIDNAYLDLRFYMCMRPKQTFFNKLRTLIWSPPRIKPISGEEISIQTHDWVFGSAGISRNYDSWYCARPIIENLYD